MKTVKILGSGCKNCETTAKLVAQVAEEVGVSITVEKVTDMAEIMGYGVMSTPGVVIEGKVVHTGGVPTSDLIRQWF